MCYNIGRANETKLGGLMFKSAKRVADELLHLVCDIQDIERVNIWDLKEHLDNFNARYTDIVFSIDRLRRTGACTISMFEYLVERLETLTNDLDSVRNLVSNNVKANQRLQTEIAYLMRVVSTHPTQEAIDSVGRMMDYLLDNNQIAWDDSTLDLSDRLFNIVLEVENKHPLVV